MTDDVSSPLSAVAPFSLAPRPSSRVLILFTILAALLAFAVCLGLRLMEVPAWNQEFLQVQGEPLMATHDAYYFLAGGQGTARPHADHEPFFRLTRFFYAVTGMSYGHMGFWLPIFLAPLVIFPLAFLAWREGLPEAILPMGIMAGATMGYLARTRLGYYDHDMLSLFLAVLFTVGFFFFLELWVALHRSVETSPEDQNDSFPMFLVLWLVASLLGWGWIEFYPSGRPIFLGITAIGLVTALIMTRGAEARSLIATAIGLIFLVAVNLYWGIVLAVLTFMGLKLMARMTQRTWPFWIVLGGAWVALFFLANLDALFSEVAWQLTKYAPMLQEGNQTMDSLALPSVMQSVREARLLPLHDMAERSGVTWWLFSAGVVGYLYLCWRRPLYLLFLPLLILSVGAVKLGSRFTMYGGVPAGLGLGLGTALLLRNLGLRQRVGALVLSAFGVTAALLLFAQVEALRPNPVLPKVYAETLLKLRDVTPPGARIWTWWDYGYATQYYARRASFGDGALNSGEHLFALALVHATPSPTQAAQMIKMVTANQKQRREQRAGIHAADNSSIPWPLYLQPPLGDLSDTGVDQIRTTNDGLTQRRSDWPMDLPEQYFLVSWANIAMAYWITTFGNWDPETGQGRGGSARQIGGEISVDLDIGVLNSFGDDPVALDGFMSVSADGLTEHRWANDTGRYVIYSDYQKRFLVLDDVVYNSMMVRMLLADPSDFEEDFELVVDNYPLVRVYRVR